jgi:Tol biopolymer transport system component
MAIAAELSWDGKQLLYSRREGMGPLFLLNLESGQERQLAECGHARSLAASPGALYYFGCPDGEAWPLFRFDTASAKHERLGVLTSVNMGLTVSPDGKTIVYSRENLAGADLMMVENFR